ncbi:MAG: 2-hydroxy-3-oxopropionate reductase, partial [uncultured Chthoniobacterales bacterium]
MSRRTQKNVGVIGLGIIGRRVADNLRRRGFHVFVWNRTPRPFPNFVGSPAEVAELCDFVQIFVSDDEALMQMVQEMKPSLHVQHVIMAHSTVAPHTMRNAAEIVKRRGAQFLDAPFTGSKIPAEKGELVYYVAGDEAAYRRAKPVLQASSKEIIEIGEIGQATTVKIATNMITAATVQAAAEALALVHNSGLAPEKLTAALSGNASNSGTLSMKLPKMIQGDFDPHFSVKHMLKDVQIAARMARSHGLKLGATEAARDSLLDEANSGRADQDFSSLVRFFFPEGLPGEISAASEGDDAQQKLNGVDDEAAAERQREERASREDDAAPTARQAEERAAATPDEIDADKLPSLEGERGEGKSSEARRETDENGADPESDRHAARAIPANEEKPTTALAEEPADTSATQPTNRPESAGAKDDSPPVASDHEPAAAEREPATDRRESATDQREPATDQREPATDQREPATDQREPATDQREPATDQRESATDQRE